MYNVHISHKTLRIDPEEASEMMTFHREREATRGEKLEPENASFDNYG